jgi:hypothetical protein
MLFKGAEHKFKASEHKFKGAEHVFKVRNYKNYSEGETFVGQKRNFCRTKMDKK